MSDQIETDTDVSVEDEVTLMRTATATGDSSPADVAEAQEVTY
ncbi:hypothetical protein [Schaalia sp. 19OD2882]|nr:hypothetical protein [Schaalia sp. 19OD2882]